MRDMMESIKTAPSAGGKEMRQMKNRRKFAALLACVLLLGVLLSACAGTKCSSCGKTIRGTGHSTSMGILCDDCYNSSFGLGTTTRRTSTGVWIAITVMVFVAVFAATSGVVYLVLQKLLPPEDSKPHTARRSMPREEVYDDISARRPIPRPAAPAQSHPPVQNRPAASPSRPAVPHSPTGEWVCPRDRSRNSGPYCTVCGVPRPQAPRPAAPRPAAGTAPVQRPAQPVQQRPSAQPAPKTAPADAWQTPSMYDAYGTEPAAYSPRAAAPATDPAPAYTGKFAKKTQSDDLTSPSVSFQQEEPTAAEPEYDADLLAAIFREAEQGTDQD